MEGVFLPNFYEILVKDGTSIDGVLVGGSSVVLCFHLYSGRACEINVVYARYSLIRYL